MSSLSEALQKRIREDIERGADSFDVMLPEKGVPDWYNHIDLDTLEMGGSCGCVGGQLQRYMNEAGTFWSFLVTLGHFEDNYNIIEYQNVARHFGLMLPDVVISSRTDREEVWEFSTSVWKEEIERRRSQKITALMDPKKAPKK